MKTITLLLATLFAAPLHATTLVPADLGEMSRDARAIAIGRVIALDPRVAPGRRGIDTLVTLEAESYLKGALGATVQFAVPGGQIGRFRNVVVGAPQLEIGQRIVVFLGANGPSVPFIIGFNQGLFRVTLDNGRSMVSPHSGVTLAAGVATVGRAPASRRPMELAEFAREVRALAGRRP
jgi:hypothetical protein